MKTLILSLIAITAFAGVATAHDPDTRLERRWNANGQQFFLYARVPAKTTTVAVYRQGKGLGEVGDRSERPVRLERRWNANGQPFYLFARER